MEAQINYIFNILWGIIKNWWWVLMPFILYRLFLFHWLWWRKEEWDLIQEKILLEIRMPKETLKPIRAMEQVFSAFWGGVYDPPDWWEKWIEGKQLHSLQLELVSLGGEPHLYIRIPETRRNVVEAAIYSQYPDAEISIVDDYTKYVPRDVPNKDWDIWGTDYQLIKDDVYPIKTYAQFFEESPDTSKEEKRVDPLSTLLEGMGTLGRGEQLWIQIVIEPITKAENDFISRGKTIVDELAKRPKKAKRKMILLEAAEELMTGKVPGKEEEKQEEPMIPVEMRLTPGEREKVEGVENKIAKRCFESFFRFLYLAKRDNFMPGAKAIPFSFFAQFATENFNAPKPWPKTITKIHRYPVLDILRPRRVFVRKRRLFFRYINRFPPLYPKKGGTYIFNIEELATLFHFSGRIVIPAPFVRRVEAKKGEAPLELPVE